MYIAMLLPTSKSTINNMSQNFVSTSLCYAEKVLTLNFGTKTLIFVTKVNILIIDFFRHYISMFGAKKYVTVTH